MRLLNIDEENDDDIDENDDDDIDKNDDQNDENDDLSFFYLYPASISILLLPSSICCTVL